MAETADVSTKTILVVDDCAIQRALARTALADAGYGIAEALDGAEALAILDCIDVHLVICDESMPNMTGTEFLGHVRASATHQHVPVLMLTAMPLGEAIARAGDLEVAGWVPKPIAPLGLTEMVNAILGDGGGFGDDDDVF